VKLPILFVLAMATPAFAQKPDASAAFERAKKLMAEGKTAEACAEFEASMRFEAANGTLYNMALCHEKLGKLATAWTEMKELAANDSNGARAKDATKHAAALEPRLTRMHLVAPKTPNTVIERDGKDVTVLVGVDEPVDPGSYTFVARSPGHQPKTVLADLRGEGRTIDVSIPDLETQAAPMAPVVVPQGEYSTRLPLRPLVLPKGMAELGAWTSVYSGMYANTPIDLTLDMRYGLGKVELEANIDFHARYAETTNKPSQPADVFVAGRYAVTPLFTLGLEYTDVEPRGTPQQTTGTEYRAVGARKYLLANNVALVAHGGVEYLAYNAPCFHPTAFSAIGEGYAQFAATELLSFEAGALLSLHLSGTLFKDSYALAFVGRGQYAIMRQLDAYASAQFPAQPTTDPTAYIVGLAWRTR
jgi:hypothetical protein